MKIFTWKSAQIVTRSIQVSRKLLTQLAELIALTSVSVEGNSCCRYRKKALKAPFFMVAFYFGFGAPSVSRAVGQIIVRMVCARAAGASLEPGCW